MDTKQDTAPDTEGQAPEVTEGQEPNSGQQGTGKSYDEKYVSQLRGEAAGYRRELAEAKAALQAIEDAKKSDLEKAQEAATAAEARAAAAEQTLLRRAIADEVGLPPALAARLQGSDEESLRADAQALLDTVGKAAPPSQKVDLDAGPKGGPAKPPTLEDRVAAAQKAGDVRGVIALQNQRLAESRQP